MNQRLFFKTCSSSSSPFQQQPPPAVSLSSREIYRQLLVLPRPSSMHVIFFSRLLQVVPLSHPLRRRQHALNKRASAARGTGTFCKCFLASNLNFVRWPTPPPQLFGSMFNAQVLTNAPVAHLGDTFIYKVPTLLSPTSCRITQPPLTLPLPLQALYVNGSIEATESGLVKDFAWLTAKCVQPNAFLHLLLLPSSFSSSSSSFSDYPNNSPEKQLFLPCCCVVVRQ